MNKKKIEKLIEQLIIEIGEDINRPGLKNTPERVARMYKEIFSNLHTKPPKLTTFPTESDEMIVLNDIPFYSICEHHMLPFFGTAAVAYIPYEKMIGLSKVVRLVDYYSKRLQTQERLTGQIAEKLNEGIKPKGVAVYLRAEHFCISMRGIKKSGIITSTNALRGVFLEDEKARNEFMELIE